MTEPISSDLYTHGFEQLDPFKSYSDVQSLLIQQQMMEANRRKLQGEAAGGRALKGAMAPGGAVDQQKLNQGYQGLPDELVPGAVEAGSAASSAATKAQQDAIDANTKSVAYFAGSVVPTLLANPDGLTTKQSLDIVGQLNKRGLLMGMPATALNKEFASLPDDAARRDRMLQITEQGVGAASVEVTDPITKEKRQRLVADILHEQLGGREPAATDESAAATAEPGSVPATGRIKKRLGSAATGPSASEEATAAGTAVIDNQQRDRDLARYNAAPVQESMLDSMLTEAKQITTGNYAGDIADFYRRLNSLTGANIDPHRVAATEALAKTAAAFSALQGGADQTDFSQARTLIRNPDEHLSNMGFDIISRQLKGGVAFDKVLGEHLRDLKPGSKELHDWYTEWNLHSNKRVFESLMMTPEQRTYFLGAYRNKATGEWEPIDPAKPLDDSDTAMLEDYWNDYQYAKKAGWLKNIRVVGAGEQKKPQQ